MKPVKLSVVIITYNEEHNIERCLRSVKDVADEIVVVDSFSEDRTEEICRTYGVRFLQHPFAGYIEQKNYALKQATYDHVLALDADEALSPELCRSILQVKENWTADGYYFSRLNNYCGKWIRYSGWYPSRKLRLFDRRKGLWGGTNPHDRFILQKGAVKKFLPGNLLHYSYYSIREHVAQSNRFTDIIAQSFFQRGKTVSWFTIMFHPFWRGFRDFFLRGGFLDGFYGMVICGISSYETFLKYVKLRQLYREHRKKRETICFFNSSVTWGGGEKWHFDIATRLQKKGHRIVVITNRKSALYERLRETPLPVVRLRVHNLDFLNPLKVYKVVKIYRRLGVRVVISNLSADIKLGGVAGRLAGVERVIYRRGLAVPVKNSLTNRFIFRHVVTDIMANSEETKNTILANHPMLFNPDKIRVIYNGLDLNAFDSEKYEPVFSRSKEEFIIGNAGRLVYQKGQKMLIDLAVILSRKGYRFRIVIAGEGKMHQELDEYARKNGVDDKIVLLGFVENIPSFMKDIDVFCLTSLWEGFGYVLVEAMAGSRPVVAFRSSSNPEIVEDGITGFLVPENNLPLMAERIEQLMNDRALCQSMGARGRKRAETVFSLHTTLQNVEKMLFEKTLFT